MGERFDSEIQKLIKKEVRGLPNLQMRTRSEVTTQLAIQFKRNLYYVAADDERRLLRLQVWSERYRVTIGYILSALVPHYQKRFAHRKTKQGNQLPVSIATLTGKNAEWVLKQQMAKDFPDGENRSLWAQAQRRVILQMRDEAQNGEDTIQSRRKRLLDFEWASRYVSYYSRRIGEMRRELSLPRKGQKPYRGNPWL